MYGVKGVRVEGGKEGGKERGKKKGGGKQKKIKMELSKGSDANRNRGDDSNRTPNETKGITRQKEAKAECPTRSTASFLVYKRHARETKIVTT